MGGSRVLANGDLASQFNGQTVTVVVTSVHVHSASIIPKKRFSKKAALETKYNHLVGSHVKSLISFESPEGIAVFEGTIGKVGMVLEQFECVDEPDGKDSLASTSTGLTNP